MPSSRTIRRIDRPFARDSFTRPSSSWNQASLARIASLPPVKRGRWAQRRASKSSVRKRSSVIAALVEILVAAEDLYLLGDEGVAREKPPPLGDVEGELVDGMPRGGDDAGVEPAERHHGGDFAGLHGVGLAPEDVLVEAPREVVRDEPHARARREDLHSEGREARGVSRVVLVVVGQDDAFDLRAPGRGDDLVRDRGDPRVDERLPDGVAVDREELPSPVGPRHPEDRGVLERGRLERVAGGEGKVPPERVEEVVERPHAPRRSVSRPRTQRRGRVRTGEGG